MLRKIFRFVLLGSQVALVGLFFTVSYDKQMNSEEKYVSVIHNDNLHKIANALTLLFEEEVIPDFTEEEEFVFEELPSSDVQEEVVEEEKEEVKDESVPLIGIDSSKYKNNIPMGFKVTENNKNYTLTDYEFDVVVAVVAGEYGGDLNDALAVVSVILNRCDSKTWAAWAGSNPYKQVIAKGQFEVYLKDYYMAYMPGGSKYGSTKYEVARQAVIDGLNGIRNNSYMGFRAWYLTNYSSKYVTVGGNRYGYN